MEFLRLLPFLRTTETLSFASERSTASSDFYFSTINFIYKKIFSIAKKSFILSKK